MARFTSRTLLAFCLLAQSASAFYVQPKTLPMTKPLQSTSFNDALKNASVGDSVGFQGAGPAGPMARVGPNGVDQLSRDIWDTLTPETVQGGSLRTWSFSTPAIERVQVLLRTEGRPLSANVELWQGPDNTPQRMGIYLEDGDMRPFCAVIETPRGQNAVAIRNTGQLEFPLAACVEAEIPDGGESPLGAVSRRLMEMVAPKTIQGGAIQTYAFAPDVASVQISLRTDGRPLNARIELLQGPNNNKQVIELYTEDGRERPFFAVIETPGTGNVVRIVNTATVEFPLGACVEPYLVEPGGGGTGYGYGNEYQNGASNFFLMDRDRR